MQIRKTTHQNHIVLLEGWFDKMVKINQYSITNKSLFFLIGFSPIVSLVRYFPMTEHTWNTFGFVSFFVSSWIIALIIIIFKTSRKKIIFSEKGVQIQDFRRIIKDYSWNLGIVVDIDNRYLIREIKISFNENYVFLFEADRKTIRKIMEICPVETIKQQFLRINNEV